METRQGVDPSKVTQGRGVTCGLEEKLGPVVELLTDFIVFLGEQNTKYDWGRGGGKGGLHGVGATLNGLSPTPIASSEFLH